MTDRRLGWSTAAIAALLVFAGALLYAGLRLYESVDDTPAEVASKEAQAVDDRCGVLQLGGSSPASWFDASGAVTLDPPVVSGLSMALLGEEEARPPITGGIATVRRALVERNGEPRSLDDVEQAAVAELDAWFQRHC